MAFNFGLTAAQPSAFSVQPSATGNKVMFNNAPATTFGAPQQPAATSAFGQPAAPAVPSLSFGSQPANPTTNSFSMPQAPRAGTTTFGQPQPTTSAFGTSFGAKPATSTFNTFGAKPSISSYSTKQPDPLEPPSPFDELLKKLTPYVPEKSQEVNSISLFHSFSTPKFSSKFRSSYTVSPPFSDFQTAESALLKFTSEHGSIEFLEPLQVKNLPENLDEICKISPGEIFIGVENHCICTLCGIEAEGETRALRLGYMQDLSIQSGVEFVAYFEESGLWVFRK